MGVAMCPFLIWPSHFLDASYVPAAGIVQAESAHFHCDCTDSVVDFHWRPNQYGSSVPNPEHDV